MKKAYTGLLLFLFLLTALQAQDLKNTVALQTCQCLENSPVSLRKSKPEQVEAEMQACMTKSMMAYIPELIKELGMSMDELKTEKGKKASQQFGKEIGAILLEECAVFRDFTAKINGQGEGIGEEYEAVLRIRKVKITKAGAWVVFEKNEGIKMKLAINHYFYGAEGLLEEELKITNLNFVVKWKKTKILNLKTRAFELVDEIVSMRVE